MNKENKKSRIRHLERKKYQRRDGGSRLASTDMSREMMRKEKWRAKFPLHIRIKNFNQEIGIGLLKERCIGRKN